MDAGEAASPREGAEDAKDLLLDLAHAQVSFDQVDGEGDAGIIQERQGADLTIVQAAQEVVGLALAWTAPEFRDWILEQGRSDPLVASSGQNCSRRIFGPPRCEQPFTRRNCLLVYMIIELQEEFSVRLVSEDIKDAGR